MTAIENDLENLFPNYYFSKFQTDKILVGLSENKFLKINLMVISTDINLRSMWFTVNPGDLFNWTNDGILFYSQQTQGVFEMEWTFETLGVSARQAFVKFIWWFYCFGARDERSSLARIHTLVPCLITETTWPLSSVTYSYVISSQCSGIPENDVLLSMWFIAGMWKPHNSCRLLGVKLGVENGEADFCV